MNAERKVSSEQANLRAFSNAELFERFKTCVRVEWRRFRRVNFLWEILFVEDSSQCCASGLGNVQEDNGFVPHAVSTTHESEQKE